MCAINLSFLSAVLGSERFASGELHTGFIDEAFPQGFDPAALGAEDARLLAVAAACVHERSERRAAAISGQLPGHPRRFRGRWVVVLGEHRIGLAVTPVAAGCEFAADDGTTWRVRTAWMPGQTLLEADVNGESLVFQVAGDGPGYRLRRGGWDIRVLVLSEVAAALHRLMPVKAAADTSRFLLSPMPGLLVAVLVNEGQTVQPGQDLAIIEAMKMENVLAAERECTVAKVLAAPGDSLAVDQPVIEFA